MRRSRLALLAAIGMSRIAWASPDGDAPPDRDQRRTGPLPILASIVPGVILPGSGSFVARDKKTARRLLEMAGIGLGAAIVGGEAIVWSGGDPWAVGLGQPLLVGGVGLFVSAWASDIFNAAQADAGRARPHPPYSLEAGVVWTHDAYRDRALMHLQGQAIVAPRLELVADAHRSYDGAYNDGNLQARVRILHSYLDDESAWNGTYLELRATGRIRDDADDEVQAMTMEGELAGRLDLNVISSDLRGSFAELATGLGAERTAYTMAHDSNSLLLARAVWGMYLGHRGEASVYYDHRRDTLAGGLASFHTAGFIGSFGARLDMLVSGPWAIHGEFEWGSATVSTIGVRYEGGSR